jgi:hypothetical protein
MAEQTRDEPIIAAVISWSARILSVISIGILLLFFIGEAGFGRPVRLTAQEWIGLLFFPLGVAVGMVVGWRWEGVRAGIAVGSLVAFYMLNLVASGNLPSGPFFVLFTLPGILFGVSWMLGRKWRRISR